MERLLPVLLAASLVGCPSPNTPEANDNTTEEGAAGLRKVIGVLLR